MAFDADKALRARFPEMGAGQPLGLPASRFNPDKALNGRLGPTMPIARQIVDSNPDHEAEILDQAKRQGLRPDTVRTNQTEVKMREIANSISAAPAGLRVAMRNLEFAMLAKDDIPNLSWWAKHAELFRQGDIRTVVQGRQASNTNAAWLEVSLFGKIMDNLRDTVDESVLSNEDGTPNAVGRLSNWARGMAEERDRVPRQRVGGPDVTQQERYDAIVARDLSPLMQHLQNELKVMEGRGVSPKRLEDINGAGDILSFLTENFASSLPYMGALITSGKFSPITATLLMGGEADAELREKFPDMTAEERGPKVLAAGAIMASLELFGLSKIIGVVKPSKMVGEAVAGTLAKKLIEKGVPATGARMLEAALAEGVTEGLQEKTIMLMVELSGGEYTYEEAKSRLLNSIAAGGGIGGGLRGGVEAGGAVKRTLEKWGRSGETRDRLAEINERAAESKLKGRSPAEFKRYLDSVAVEPAHIEIPASELNTFFQGVVSDEDLTQLGVERGDFEAALTGGGDVTVPVANYATHFAGTDAETVFDEHGRFDASQEMSPAEAKAFEEGGGRDAVQAVQRQVEENTNAVETIHERLTEQAMATGRLTRTQAEHNARLGATFFAALAQRKGEAADSLAAQAKLEIRGRDVLPDLATDEAAAEAPPASPSLPIDKVFTQAPARTTKVDREVEGTVQTIDAGLLKDNLDQRHSDANALLKCLGYA